MTLQAKDGLLFDVGGALAGSADCCDANCDAEPSTCGGCSGDQVLTLSVDIDASAAFGNPVVNLGCGGDPACSCYGCDLLTGVYEITGGDGTDPNQCGWTGTFPGPGYQEICNGNASDNGEEDTIINFALSFDGTDYLATFSVDFGVQTYIWVKNLGSTQPVCTEVFPLTFVRAESYQQEFFDFFGEVGEHCDMRYIDITVDIA